MRRNKCFMLYAFMFMKGVFLKPFFGACLVQSFYKVLTAKDYFLLNKQG
jgi:hypothetical protein